MSKNYAHLLLIILVMLMFTSTCYLEQTKDKDKSAQPPSKPKETPLPQFKFLRGLTGHTNVIRSVSFSPDVPAKGGQLLVSASDDKTVRLWNLKDSKEIKVFTGHTEPLWAAAFSPDGKMIASASDDCTVRIWDPAKDEAFSVLKHPAQVWTVAFTPDSKLIASGDDSGKI